MKRRMVLWAAAAALAIGAGVGEARAEAVRIAYLSPSFDISDAWERVFWAIQGRLDEQGVEYEMQQLAVPTHVDHSGQLAQVEAVIAAGADYTRLRAIDGSRHLVFARGRAKIRRRPGEPA